MFYSYFDKNTIHTHTCIANCICDHATHKFLLFTIVCLLYTYFFYFVIISIIAEHGPNGQQPKGRGRTTPLIDQQEYEGITQLHIHAIK